MTPIDELCKGLDERGVKYDATSYDNSVFWGDAEYELRYDGSTRLIVEGATPEQAINATVGPETMPKQRGCKTEIKVVTGNRMWSYYAPESSNLIVNSVRACVPIMAQDKEGHFAIVNTRNAAAIVVRNLDL